MNKDAKRRRLAWIHLRQLLESEHSRNFDRVTYDNLFDDTKSLTKEYGSILEYILFDIIPAEIKNLEENIDVQTNKRMD